MKQEAILPMKIQRISKIVPGHFQPKSVLSTLDWEILQDAVTILLRAYYFYELNQHFSTAGLFKRLPNANFDRLVIAPTDGISGHQIGDYLLRAAFLTDDRYILLAANHISMKDYDTMVLDTPSTFFLVTDDDRNFVTEDLYQCFIDRNNTAEIEF